MHRLAALAALAATLFVAGCATLTESTQQQVMVQTIADNREIAGVGCVLYNDVGKWFVTTPARVMIRKSAQPLRVDCHKASGNGVDAGISWAYEKIESKVNATLWGNVVLTAGAGYLVDRNTGAGFDYPSTLTVIMHPGDAADGRPAPAAGVTVY
ncbi:hypothetical protein HSX11_21380 [Oxalobacteraceae bacterium]|nr:hypothetical protein [Oxalobacteraceae bacterium]